MKFRINYYTWAFKEATATVSAKSFADAREKFFNSEHGVNSMHIDSIEKV